MVKSSEVRDKRLRAIALVVIIILISWPVLFMDLAKGHDLLFHLQRIEGIRQDVSLTHLPVRMQSGWMHGYGYPVSILYGDIFLYIGAVFRKIGLPVMASFRLFMLCVNTATVLISYFSFRAFNRGWVPVITTAAYTMSSYRLVDAYVRSAIGETLAITFFPAVAACIFMIIKEEDKRRRRIYSVILSFAFVAVICSHTITTSMMLVVLVLFCPASLVIFGIKGQRMKQFGNILMSGALTVLLALFFVFPFLDFYLNAGISFALSKTNGIQGEGVDVASIFDFVCNPFNNASGAIQRTPGPVLVIVLICAVIYCIFSAVTQKKFEHHGRIVFETVAGFIVLLMSSCYFPWDLIETGIPVLGGILTAIEFPMRYLVFVVLFLSLLTGDLLNGLFGYMDGRAEPGVKRTTVETVCYALIAVLCIFNVAQLCVHSRTYDKRADYVTVEDLGVWEYYAMDFLLDNTTDDDLPLGLVHEGMLSMEVLSRDSNEFLIACVTGPEYGWIQLPVYNYPYYHATDLNDPGMEFEIHDGGNRTVGVLLPANYEGIVHIFWREPVSWRISELVSVLTFVACVVFLFMGKGKNGFFKKAEK